MTKTITIDPVTRIEGHSKITIQLNEAGKVEDARFHVTQYRGFEKLSEGRMFHEMPSLTARICGICPVSHLITSAKTCDDLLAVQIPETGAKLRRIMNLAQHIQSHALSFFYLSSPDFVLGFDSDPAERNIFGVFRKYPELAEDGIKLRQFGQEIIELLGEKRIHPAWLVPGGVNEPLTQDHLSEMTAGLPDAKERILRTLEWYKGIMYGFNAEVDTFANFRSLFMGLVTEDGTMDCYDGLIRIKDSNGNIIEDQVPASRYQELLAEAVEPDSYLKSPYYRPRGYPDGIIRVGPLARMNVSDRLGTPLADEEHQAFQRLQKGQVLGSFHYHYARLIEILHDIEKIELLLNDDDILSKRVRAVAEPNRSEGFGMAEAPRGTLMHHYRIDDNGLITWANMVIATGFNNLAMNQGVYQVATEFLNGNEISEGMLNRVEGVIRVFDPCLSCSTHAIGGLALEVDLLGPDGELLDRKQTA